MNTATPTIPSEPEKTNSDISYHESPLDTLLEESIEEMDTNRLRHHLAAIRELRTSATKRAAVLREESETIAKKRAPKAPKVNIADLF